jgi:hypothetical protein
MRVLGAIALCLVAAAPVAAQTRTLAVVQAVFHDRGESAPAIAPGYQYTSGELMYFSFRIGGYSVKNDRVKLRWLIYASDPEGLLLWEPFNGTITEEVSHNDENWLPKVSQTLPLPPQLGPGGYRLLIKVSDENAGTSVEREMAFRVGGRELASSEGFSILNEGFYRSDQDRTALAEPVYKPGSAVVVRFQLAGFKLGEKNRFEVEYGLRVLRPSGREMYAEPKAAQESDAPYYPKRVMNGVMGLNLTPDLTPGEYTIVVTARDVVGQAGAEKQLKFKVEK